MLPAKRIPYTEEKKKQKFSKDETNVKINPGKDESSTSLSPVYSIRLIKTVKSQQRVRVKLHKEAQITESKPAVLPILIKSVEKRIALLKDTEEPSPIVSSTKNHFYSITDEETKDIRLILNELKK